jgi:hypothetical protein
MAGAHGVRARAHAGRLALVASLAIVALAAAACLGPSTGELAMRYTQLADTANTAAGPLILSLASASEPATRAPLLRGLADVERTFADGLAALSATGPVQAAIGEVVALTRGREQAYRAASQALTREAQDAALVPILGAGGASFGAAVGRLRTVLGLPPAGSTAPPAGSTAPPDGSPDASPLASAAP